MLGWEDSNEQIATVSFRGNDNLPPWAITHFLQRTAINHLKLTTIQRVCYLIGRGWDDSNFVVAAQSAVIFPKQGIRYEDFTEFVEFARKGESPENFWKIILHHHRPIVFYDEGDSKLLLYDFLSPEALTIKKLVVESAPLVDLRGLAGSFVDLFYASSREERARLEWLIEQIGQSANNVESIVTASHAVNDSRTPPGVRRYAGDVLDSLLKQQRKLNMEFGINDPHIDELT